MMLFRNLGENAIRSVQFDAFVKMKNLKELYVPGILWPQINLSRGFQSKKCLICSKLHFTKQLCDHLQASMVA